MGKISVRRGTGVRSHTRKTASGKIVFVRGGHRKGGIVKRRK